MSKLALEIEDISKLYQLGKIGTGSLKRDLYQWWATSVQKKDTSSFQDFDPDQPYIWALKQVNFTVKEGEVWGIVGGNGSGKSTLLKVISRIIRPTHGVVRGNGKLSSMLEVGTGFHQELSGRENIYLSGYILGMNRHDIRQRFDEIVEFSGIGPFIDTPVKRYSSGMYVRLAFAVASHLRSDILIVDEVLSVGDAEFQKKCFDKMQEFSRSEGRTILFVSHNLQTVSHLCKQALWLKRGNVVGQGPVQSILSQYVAQSQAGTLSQEWSDFDRAPGNRWVRLMAVQVIPDLPSTDMPIDVRTPLTVKIRACVLEDNLRLLLGFQVFAYGGECVFDIMSSFTDCKKGILEGTCEIPGHFLNDGSYSVSLVIYKNNWEEYFQEEECLSFDVEDYRDPGMNFSGKWWGAVRPNFPLALTQE